MRFITKQIHAFLDFTAFSSHRNSSTFTNLINRPPTRSYSNYPL